MRNIKEHIIFSDQLRLAAEPFIQQGAYSFFGLKVDARSLAHAKFFLTPIMVVGAEMAKTQPVGLIETGDALFNHIPVKGTRFDAPSFQEVLKRLDVEDGVCDLRPLIVQYDKILRGRGLRGAGIDNPPPNLATASMDEMPHEKWTPWRALVWCFKRL
ncbi:MAG: hypothetical protein HY985_00355 [Magnetospirillum sp.]|nr:hypothetical protein [Magnetospirillum sp.]